MQSKRTLKQKKVKQLNILITSSIEHLIPTPAWKIVKHAVKGSALF